MIIMDELMDRFIEYAKFDGDGDISGITRNAPNDAVEAYEEYKRILKQAKDEGVKI